MSFILECLSEHKDGPRWTIIADRFIPLRKVLTPRIRDEDEEIEPKDLLDTFGVEGHSSMGSGCAGFRQGGVLF